jgi:uncharacterized protein with von Willebrand factor type A (vWA) domain
MNEEPGSAWMQRITEYFPKLVWLNPVPESAWQYTQSIGLTRDLVQGRMYPLTLDGLSEAIRYLAK